MPSTRRAFLQQAGAVAAVSALGARTFAEDAKARPAGANERFVFGVIGPGGQGTKVMKAILGTKQADVAWVCDTDQKRADAAAEVVREAGGGGATPKTTQDLRRVLDDKSVDCVIIATPDHWHAPATILAC